MKKILITFGAFLTAHLYIGYYTELGVHGGNMVFFIKKYPTFQVEFENLYTREGDHTPLARMNMVEASIIIDYCKHRLGIDTWLETEEELEACKAR
ncbi:hypothetical protein IV01_06845 [Pseudomonas syringae]|uniref:Uncharacterized protein n=1 Tax=Pseudomonas syringae TaxID=317 RepID=A0A085VN81_PSESX|nr:hypothetical protein IV01_06845 [Pseudomonas syringae]